MSHTIIRLRLTDQLFRKYKVMCAIENKSMTQITESIITDYVKKHSENIKIINLEKNK
jgi:hypothetical protein